MKVSRDRHRLPAGTKSGLLPPNVDCDDVDVARTGTDLMAVGDVGGSNEVGTSGIIDLERARWRGLVLTPTPTPMVVPTPKPDAKSGRTVMEQAAASATAVNAGSRRGREASDMFRRSIVTPGEY